MRIRAAFAVLWISLGLGAVGAACTKTPTSGPVEIKFDRDTCHRCSMVISDKRFAAEIRGGSDRKIYKFDDFGCAMHWLKDQSWGSEAATEIWVGDSQDGTWLNGREARFVSGKTTPMGYGFGAFKSTAVESLGFDEARKQIETQK